MRNRKIKESIRMSKAKHAKKIVSERTEGPWVAWVYAKEKDKGDIRPGLAAGRVNPFLFKEEYFAQYGRYRRYSYHEQKTTRKWSYNLKEQK